MHKVAGKVKFVHSITMSRGVLPSFSFALIRIIGHDGGHPSSHEELIS